MIIEQRYVLKDSAGGTLATIVGSSDYQPGRSGRVREWKVTYSGIKDGDSVEETFFSFAQLESSLSQKFFSGNIEIFKKLLESIS